MCMPTSYDIIKILYGLSIFLSCISPRPHLLHATPRIPHRKKATRLIQYWVYNWPNFFVIAHINMYT